RCCPSGGRSARDAPTPRPARGPGRPPPLPAGRRGRRVPSPWRSQPRWGTICTMQRNTRQRAAILETLARQDDFRSAQQIHEQMKSDGETVGLATVYRTLQALTRTGRLDVLVAGDGESLYRQCEVSGQHDNLFCRECGRTLEFLALKKEAAMSAGAWDHGFSDLDHTHEVFRMCMKHSRIDETE